jgi:hypothetical protein
LCLAVLYSAVLCCGVRCVVVMVWPHQPDEPQASEHLPKDSGTNAATKVRFKLHREPPHFSSTWEAPCGSALG